MADQPTRWTLDRLLDECAVHFATHYQDAAFDDYGPALRTAAARLRGEMAMVAAEPASQWYGSQVLVSLERINAGPAPAATPTTGMEPAFADELAKLHGHPGRHCWLGCCELPPGPVAPTTGMEPTPAGWPCAECGKNPKLENSAICGDCLARILHPAAPVSVQEACKTWCGTHKYFCTPACRDAGRPLHPVKP